MELRLAEDMIPQAIEQGEHRCMVLSSSISCPAPAKSNIKSRISQPSIHKHLLLNQFSAIDHEQRFIDHAPLRITKHIPLRYSQKNRKQSG
jgi:hypothetical protein